MTSLSSEHSFNSPSHTVYVTPDDYSKQLGGHFAAPEWSLFSAFALSYLVHPRCALLDLNPGSLQAMEAQKMWLRCKNCCVNREVYGRALSCCRVTWWGCLWMKGTNSDTRIGLMYLWTFKSHTHTHTPQHNGVPDCASEPRMTATLVHSGSPMSSRCMAYMHVLVYF